MNADRARQPAVDVQPEEETVSLFVVRVRKSPERILGDGSFSHVGPIAKAKDRFSLLAGIRTPAIDPVEQ